MDAEKFGGFVQLRRKELGLSQAALAEKLHVTAKAVSRWERGVGFPDIKLLEPLADALEITIVELMHSQKIQEPLPKEEAAAIVTQTVTTLQEQERLSWKRKAILFFGTIVILAAQGFLIWVANYVIRDPRWVSALVSLIGMEGGICGVHALRAIVTRSYLTAGQVRVVITGRMWVAFGVSAVGMILLLLSMKYLPNNTVLRDSAVFGSLMLIFASGLYYMVKMREADEE